MALPILASTAFRSMFTSCGQPSFTTATNARSSCAGMRSPEMSKFCNRVRWVHRAPQRRSSGTFDRAEGVELSAGASWQSWRAQTTHNCRAGIKIHAKNHVDLTNFASIGTT